MSLDHRTRQRMLEFCLQIQEDDGEDPRVTKRKERSHKKVDHKTHQLCRQVFEALTLSIAGDDGDPLLALIQILAVEPAPDSSRLLVTVTADCPGDSDMFAEIQLRLQTHAARLRCQVAAAITRKKAPALFFHWQPPIVWRTNADE